MIFETDKFTFEAGQRCSMQFSNDFSIDVKCYNNDCFILYGWRNRKKEKFVPIEDVERFLIELITENVKNQGAKLVSIKHNKNKKSTYSNIMHSILEH